MKKVLLILADGFEEIEAVATIDILRRAKIKVCIASPDFKIVTGGHNIQIKADVLLDEVKDQVFEAVILPGGNKGVENMEASPLVAEMVLKHHNEGKLIAAICAAPRLLHNIGLLTERHATSHPGTKDLLVKSHYSEDKVVLDGNILTSRGPGTAMEFGYKIVDLLKADTTSQTLREAMVV